MFIIYKYVSEPRKLCFLGRDFVAYIYATVVILANKFAYANNHINALTHVHAKFLVAMRLGDTPVPIPNTLVKT